MDEITILESIQAVAKGCKGLTDEIMKLQSRVEKLEAENTRLKEDTIPSLKNQIEVVRKRAFN